MDNPRVAPNCLYKTIKIVSLSMFYSNDATNSIRPAFSQFLLIELAVTVFATCALGVASETSAIPVSYTHLDVYKRQSILCVLNCVLFSLEKCMFSLIII